MSASPPELWHTGSNTHLIAILNNEQMAPRSPGLSQHHVHSKFSSNPPVHANSVLCKWGGCCLISTPHLFTSTWLVGLTTGICLMQDMETHCLPRLSFPLDVFLQEAGASRYPTSESHKCSCFINQNISQCIKVWSAYSVPKTYCPWIQAGPWEHNKQEEVRHLRAVYLFS